MPLADSHPPFRRSTDPVLVTVGYPAGAITAVSSDMMTAIMNLNAFCVVNPNTCYVRLKGYQSSQAITEYEGWLFPPGFVAVYSTQRPKFMSAIAVSRPGFPVDANDLAPLEVSYGNGT